MAVHGLFIPFDNSNNNFRIYFIYSMSFVCVCGFMSTLSLSYSLGDSTTS